MTVMTPKQNLLAALSHAPVDWIPWTPYVGGVNTPFFVPEEIKRRQDFGEIGLYLQDELGCDILIAGQAVGHGYQTAQVHRRVDKDLIVETFDIAGRTLQRTRKRFAYGDQDTDAILRYPVRAPRDLETLEWLVRDRTVEVDGEDYRQKTSQLGERGVVHANGPRTPIMALIIEYMGVEAFVEALTDYPQKTQQAMQSMHKANLDLCRALAESECRVVGTFDDFSTYLISPSMFRTYVLPCLREYNELYHRAGQVHMVHSCGHIRHFLPMCFEVGYDAHNYVTQPPTGDTTLAEARAAWGDRITIMAAIDPVMIERDSAQTVSERVSQMLDEAGTTRSFVLMTSSKSTVPEENLRAVARVMAQARGETR
jgi:hypothetical protein